MTQSPQYNKIILAFSGGLDTSFAVPFLRETYKAQVITVTVDTSNLSPKQIQAIESRAKDLGASKHYTIPGVTQVFEKWIKYLIMLNALKGGKYPLCVGAERAIQAQELVRIAKEEDAEAVAHGSTKAGNDQIRFDTVIRTLNPHLKIITPIRDLDWTRQQEADYLATRGFKITQKITTYSINESIWGVTIGGGKIHDPWESLPKEAYLWTQPIEKTPDTPTEIILSFQRGIPTKIDGINYTPSLIMTTLNEIGSKHGYGRSIHTGDTILGIKGRIGVEAPAIFALIEAHRELEKIVLTREQIQLKENLTQTWIRLLHHGLYLDPVVADIHAFLDQNQKNVSGDVRLKFFKGNCTVEGVKSPHSLMLSDITYGETSSLWTGNDARSFAKIHSLQSLLYHKADQESKKSDKK